MGLCNAQTHCIGNVPAVAGTHGGGDSLISIVGTHRDCYEEMILNSGAFVESNSV